MLRRGTVKAKGPPPLYGQLVNPHAHVVPQGCWTTPTGGSGTRLTISRASSLRESNALFARSYTPITGPSGAFGSQGAQMS